MDHEHMVGIRNRYPGPIGDIRVAEALRSNGRKSEKALTEDDGEWPSDSISIMP